MCTDPYQWWATCIRSDKYTDHRLSVNLHNRPATDGSVVVDEWCVLVRWACVNADHWTRAFHAYQDQCRSICVDIDIYSEWRVPCDWPWEGGQGVASQGRDTSGKNGNGLLHPLSCCITEWQMGCYRDRMGDACVECRDIQTSAN